MHAHVLTAVCVLLATATAVPAPGTTATSTSAPATSTTTTSTSVTTTNNTSSPSSTIPPGYTYYPATGSYYKHYKRDVSWYVANNTCASEGAQLVVINDEVEADTVRSMVLHDKSGRYWMWTGLRYTQQGGVMAWRTINGEPLSSVFHVWAVGRPYNNAEMPCAIFGSYFKDLYDWACEDYTFYFTCEISQ